MRIVKTIFESVYLIKPNLFKDNRGFFFESYQKEKLKRLGIDKNFVQDNHSYSKEAGTVRGMHFQSPPNAQVKLIRVLRGLIKNYFVDIRKNSPTFMRFDSVVLSSENKSLLYLPAGFANGFITLVDNCEILYKVDNYYAPDSDKSFAYNDSKIGIDWGISSPILSERDSKAPLFSEIDTPFLYGENS